MKRRATQLVLALGLVLSAVVGFAVVRGFRASDYFHVGLSRVPTPDRRVEDRLRLITSHWACALFWSRTRETVTAPGVSFSPEGWQTMHDVGPPRRFLFFNRGGQPFWHGLGFRLWKNTAPTTTPYGLWKRSEYGVVAPTWFVALLGAALTFLPARALRRARRLRVRRAAGQCLACGYDLRGAEHERCPECGQVIAAAAV